MNEQEFDALMLQIERLVADQDQTPVGTAAYIHRTLGAEMRQTAHYLRAIANALSKLALSFEKGKDHAL